MNRFGSGVLLIAALHLLGCAQEPQQLPQISGFAQGTTYSITLGTEQELSLDAIAAAVDTELQRIDQVMSNYRPDSVIEMFNQSQPGTPLADEIHRLLMTAQQVHEATGGCYDPTSFSLFKLWGFDDVFAVPEQAAIEQALETVGLDRLQLNQSTVLQNEPSIHIDLSSIGQGYAVSQLAELLNSLGFKNHLVEIGGEMKASGEKPSGEPWKIGVERPVPGSQQVNAIIKLNGSEPVAVMTSGTYRHFYDQNGVQYSHIIDPRSGSPVTHDTVAVTVLMNDATAADAWSTGLLCLGADQGLQVAERLGLAVIFYELKEGELSHRMSQAASAQPAAWEIEFIEP